MSATTAAAPSVGEIVHDVLRRNYGRLRHGSELLARDAKSTPRAAENWLSAANTPNAEKLVNIMKRCPELRAAIFELVQEVE
jgi:hypothetical protein